jgi:hypothetical protein
MEHRIKIPFSHREYILPQLARHAFEVSRDITWHDITYTYGVELGLINTALPPTQGQRHPGRQRADTQYVS